jgi:pSer/pThr/pTyr-binding forkhead associated (FHA) protein
MAWLAFGMLTRELRDGELIVGSGADADWRIGTADLMPRHFVVTVRANDVSIRPASADCVVVVNDAQLLGAPRRLSDGDLVRAGAGTFAFGDAAPKNAPTETGDSALAFLIDETAQVAYPLASRSTPIGRDPSNALVIRDPTASRFHAEVRREAGGFALHSMGSGGTSLNGSPVLAPCLLREGDALEIAFTKLRFTRQPPDGRFGVAVPHSVAHDELSRRPTLHTERIPVARDNEAHRGVRRLRILFGLVVIVVLAFVAWRSLQR